MRRRQLTSGAILDSGLTASKITSVVGVVTLSAESRLLIMGNLTLGLQLAVAVRRGWCSFRHCCCLTGWLR